MNITPFAFGDNMVRVQKDEDGNPWFVAKDVCRVLGLGNVTESTKSLDDDERSSVILNTLGGDQEMNIISESGLYALIFRSRKPEAKTFSKWVRAEVLPSIRKTGAYAMPIQKPGSRIALPDDLPPEALALTPAMRQRLWRDALDSARLDNGGMDKAVEWFAKLCCLVAAAPPEPESLLNMVRQFFVERCEVLPGHNERARDLYEAFRRWHWQKRKRGDLPTVKTFGVFMGTLIRRTRSNGSFYCDVMLKKA